MLATFSTALTSEMYEGNPVFLQMTLLTLLINLLGQIL